jgi:hypothetical protein
VLWWWVEESGRERDKNNNTRADAEPSRAWTRAHWLTVRNIKREESATLANEEFHGGEVKGDIQLTAHRAFATFTFGAHVHVIWTRDI